MKKYRKKPVVIEALQFDGENLEECLKFCYTAYKSPVQDFMVIQTLEGTMECRKGDYIIKGIKGEFYPCKPDIFERTYEEVRNGEQKNV